MITGYQHPSYASSLSEFGTPRHLTLSQGWVLERQIEGTPFYDAMGCYPLFSCGNWEGLEIDLQEIARDLVSISMVTNPFGRYTEADLARWFGRRVVPFKRHFVADLSRSPSQFVSKHHRYYARRALARLTIEVCDRPAQYAQEWHDLYAKLVVRHGLRGIKAFSPRAFESQLAVPGVVMLRALEAGRAVGAHLWYVEGDVAHSHLAATNPRGYELMAPYALYWAALEAFGGTVAWLNFGGGAGVDLNVADGLTQFKRGWSTESRTAYFCGRIFDEDRYRHLQKVRQCLESSYFPAYRSEELN